MSLRSNGYMSDGDARLLKKHNAKLNLAGDCRTATKSGTCRCGPCKVCGYGPHMAIHLPAGNAWGHEYEYKPATKANS